MTTHNPESTSILPAALNEQALLELGLTSEDIGRIAEASRATGQSEPLVKVNIHRGLRKLSLIVEQMD